ncbi:MAG: RNA methyltransferase [Clostridia bacterium]|nr:RNA methyltransferase [Clostridia bacterium]
MSLTNAEIKNLKDKKYRKQNSLFMVEGEKFCRDLLDTDIEIVHTITSNKNLSGFPNIEVVSDKMLSSLATTKTNQDILCICRVKNYGFKSAGNSLILDNLQDPGNVGTLIRSALAFGFNDIYLIDGVDPYNEKVIRSSAGTILKVHLHKCDYIDIDKNKKDIADKFVVADMFGDSIDKIRLPKSRIAVIIGNEGQGVSKFIKNLADTTISIPMSKQVESLNAGVAGSIIMQKFGEVK